MPCHRTRSLTIRPPQWQWRDPISAVFPHEIDQQFRFATLSKPLLGGRVTWLPLFEASCSPVGAFSGVEPAALERLPRSAILDHNRRFCRQSTSTGLNQFLVQVVLQSHPKPAKDLLQLGIQRVQLFQNVILTLFQLVQKLTWFDIRDL